MNNTRRTCVISQPTFLPWIGYFDLMDQADCMVYLDDVQFSKQSWQQRNRIRTKPGLEYLTVPVKTAGRKTQCICDCELSDLRFADKMLRSIANSYSKAEYFDAYFQPFSDIFLAAAQTKRLVSLNLAVIEFLAAHLQIQTQTVLASELAASGNRGEYLTLICQELDADTYLSPPGSEEYLLEDRGYFDRSGIDVWMHVFEHPVYTQRHQPFEPYATALDLLLNAGPEAGAIMRSGRRTLRRLGEGQPSLIGEADANC